MDRDLVRVRHIDLPDFLTAVRTKDGHALRSRSATYTLPVPSDGTPVHRPFGDLVVANHFHPRAAGNIRFTSKRADFPDW